MKTVLAFAFAVLAGPLAAQAPVALPGVQLEETKIPAGGIREYHRGHGDVIFLRHASNRWYRVELNDGCLSTLAPSDRLSFETSTPGGGIDRFARVSQPAMGTSCMIRSIRLSAPPPQVDSQSAVTLD